MDDQWDFRTKTSVLADLGPLPEVVESNSETTWKMFLQLEAQQAASFSRTSPSSLAPLGDPGGRPPGSISVDDVMAQARRFNRICPIEPQWQRLHALLAQAGADDAPAGMSGMQFRRTPPLAKRIRVRDQVEWAAQHGLLQEVSEFLASLPEDQWVHMGE